LEFDIFLPHLAYVEIDSMIFFPALLVSILLKVRRYYKSLAFSIGVVAPLYITWDFLATLKDSWSFNPEWILGIRTVDLPVEEVFFFVVTPFATLLIYDFVRTKIADREVSWITRKLMILIALFLLAIDVFLTEYSYTLIVLIYLSSSILLVEFLDPKMFRSTNYWIFLGLTYIPFFVFDYFLTSLPVVVYGPHSILGVRIFTIPIEDAIYSFSMMNFYTVFYRKGAKVWNSA